MRLPLISALLFSLLLAACSNPVPPDKSKYIGEWRSATRMLIITADGNLAYRRNEGKTHISINAPITSFESNNIEAGIIGPFSTTFIVSVVPHLEEDGRWKMTVDGDELTKTDNTPEVAI